MLQRVYRLFGDDESANITNLSSPFTDDTSQNHVMKNDIGLKLFGIICSLAGSALLFTWRVTGFTVMVSLGSILSLCGTCFLMGPLRQLQKMFQQRRFLASLMYLLSITLTLIAGLVFRIPRWHLFLSLGSTLQCLGIL
ncbi:hypothetical protein DINM_004142 [Dirofilaria immitis]|nr:hypothetical protein [Dirofilaria immitis]